MNLPLSAEMLVQLPSVAAGHPAAIISVNGVAADLFGTFLEFCRSVIDASPVGMVRAATDQDGRSIKCQCWNKSAGDGDVTFNHLRSARPL
ncbi:MAG: hypothetical protein VXZ59_02250 [Cyanobacteriota bacterium]|nr:hypothetical protein [Cyanobacteriota bacterium]